MSGLLPYGWYLPGMGLVVGLLANLFLMQWLVRLAERILDRIPLVKSVFQGLKTEIALAFHQGVTS